MVQADPQASGQGASGTEATARRERQAAKTEETRTLPRISVRSGTPGRVGLHEQHREHPGGEVFVNGSGEFEVAVTPEVIRHIASGQLVQTAGEDVLRGREEADLAGRELRKIQRVAGVQTEAERLREQAGDLEIAAALHGQQSLGAMTPEDHREAAEDARKQAAELRQQAVDAERG